jgi:hypothetical protein
VARASEKEAGAVRAKKWAALGAVLATATAASVVFGEAPTPCYEAYRTGGLTQQQMSYEEFRDSYSDDVCATGERANTRDGHTNERSERRDPL